MAEINGFDFISNLVHLLCTPFRGSEGKQFGKWSLCLGTLVPSLLPVIHLVSGLKPETGSDSPNRWVDGADGLVSCRHPHLLSHLEV